MWDPRKWSGRLEVKPELPEGISHLSLGQKLSSSMAWHKEAGVLAQHYARPHIDLALLFLPGLLINSIGFHHWLLLRMTESYPVRKQSGRHVCPKSVCQSIDFIFYQTDGVNFQKALIINTQGTWQQWLPVYEQMWGTQMETVHS